MSDRLDALEAMLAEDPSDPFTRYAIAMELKGLERKADAQQAFRDLIDAAPDYVASYYQLGRLLVDAGEDDDARPVIERGLAVAERAGDAHAASELRDLLDELL
ncbi:MAG: hypothetical protein KDD82_13110 [Planctomycetes bacterium]|nr:hypothetical protein [Planctomycetota bacterium]